MKSQHLLNLGNARKVKENLTGILDPASLNRIEAEIETNVVALLALARRHYNFAKRQSGQNWRQKISRLYYAAYNTARAVQLYVSGAYSTDVKDHQKALKLPNDFPDRARYANQLAALRKDRNICDYDHMSTVSELALSSISSLMLVRTFMADTTTYLRSKGLE